MSLILTKYLLYSQVYGRLPFDDSDHKKLIKQAVHGVIFPSKPAVSEKCQNLIRKLLSKASDRIPMSFIKRDLWFGKHKRAAEDAARNRSHQSTEETIISDTPISARSQRGLRPPDQPPASPSNGGEKATDQ